MPTPDPEDQIAATFPAPMLLAACGGLLDAIVYLDHGHVFANAMTGNVVFLGISLVTADWVQILPHLTPICAFLTGVLASHLLKALSVHRGALAALLLEAAVLAVIAFLPVTFPQTAFVAIIAFVSAFQVATFRRVGTFSYNSTFTTGNLRDTLDGLYASLTEPDPALRFAGRQKFRSLGLICLCFLSGATVGAWTAPRLGSHALLLTEPLLLAVVTIILIRHADEAISFAMKTLRTPVLIPETLAQSWTLLGLEVQT